VKSKKPLVVSNAGPLIHLAKINLLHVLKDLYDEVITSQEVKVEVVDRGKEKGFPDAIQIEDAINRGWIRVEEIGLTHEFARTAQIAGLQAAEASVIYYAYKNKALILLDEDSARTFARALGIPVRGSLGVLLEAKERGIMPRTEALAALEKISEVMYLSAELYRIIRKEIEEA
jgi:predicted nucleic acid-binding protein